MTQFFSPTTCGPLHFIGIGGIGMSGLAEALHTLGYTIQGSDAAENYNLDRLRARGITVHVGHRPSVITPDLAAIVVSSAIKPGNPELLEARRLKIPIVRRADMLAELMRHKTAIAVAGTHGKTTTTTMVGAILEAGGLDPTTITGGIISAHGTTTRMGQGDLMVVESDESDGSFLRLPASMAIITNIDPEHMDHYGTFDAVRHAYRQLIEQLPFYGFAVVCADHPEAASLATRITDRRVYTYGLDASADANATILSLDANGATFDVTFGPRITGDAPETIAALTLPAMGRHNVQNMLAALTLSRILGLSEEAMRTACTHFAGVKRRFTQTGMMGTVRIIDDYAHHPIEIEATLRAARQAVSGTSGRVIAVMQPHRYSRLRDLFPDFCTAFHDADHVIVTDVHSAGEDPIDGITGAALADGLRRAGHQNVINLTDVADPSTMPTRLADTLMPMLNDHDLVLCLGAGSITNWAYTLPQILTAPGNHVPTRKHA
jgi:UDP-N-acetylmuramate--alanine ligase